MHIIIYVLDALRADHVGAYGYQRETTPNIDRIAADGVLFENCFTSTTWTRPVAASILSGVYPAVHKTRARSEFFAADLVRLPEILQKAGFVTAGFCTMGNIAAEIGFNRGFDSYRDLFKEPEILRKRQRLDPVAAAMVHAEAGAMALPLAEDINAPLFAWLDEHLEEDTFSFAWSIEPHVPYDAPAAFRRFSPRKASKPGEGQQDDVRGAGIADRQRLIDLYDDEIYYNDHCLGALVDFLKTKGIYDDTLLIITGDHGEAFYEHGVYSHGHAPYEEVIHVPLVVKFPDNQHQGQRVSALAALVDLLPTTVATTGCTLEELAPDHIVQGENLEPLAAGDVDHVREYVFSDTQTLEIHNRYLSIRGERWKYMRMEAPKRDRGTIVSTLRHIRERRLLSKIVRSPRHFLRNYFRREHEFLFDLARDPGEQHNLVAEHPELVRQLGQQLDSWLAACEQLGEQVQITQTNSFEENELLRQHLESLGYL